MSRSGKTIHTPAELVSRGYAPQSDLAQLQDVAARYAVAITPAMLDLIDCEDPADPIARQFVPRPRELNKRPEELEDPIGDAAHSPVEGLVHRYPDRVLVTPVHVCPIYCRFCFRRESVGPNAAGNLSEEKLAAVWSYVARHTGIWEVIVTGGDPLILSPRRLRDLLHPVTKISHVKVIRFHTRVPVVAPERVTEEMARALRLPEKATYVVLHANHARELTAAARSACATLIDSGVPMLSQSVLLRGVNDNPQALAELMRCFVETRIKPYYLHHGDLAPGTSHFRTTVQRGQDLMRHLRGRYSGLCQPTYVLDIPGGYGKSPIGPTYVVPRATNGSRDEGYLVEDFNGRSHVYPPVCASASVDASLGTGEPGSLGGGDRSTAGMGEPLS
jgi:lysine 2,3-aminomutase